MMKNKTPVEARKALEEFKVEMAEEFNVDYEHVYNLKENLTPSDSVTKQLLKVKHKSRNNPNYSFSDFLGKGF